MLRCPFGALRRVLLLELEQLLLDPRTGLEVPSGQTGFRLHYTSPPPLRTDAKPLRQEKILRMRFVESPAFILGNIDIVPDPL